jgi:hypothetical protein
MNSLARSNASIYGNKEDLYDRLKRHAYPGKKGNVMASYHYIPAVINHSASESIIHLLWNPKY